MQSRITFGRRSIYIHQEVPDATPPPTPLKRYYSASIDFLANALRRIQTHNHEAVAAAKDAQAGQVPTIGLSS
jgi:hypothetical protein